MNVITKFPAAHDYARDLRLPAMFEGAALGIGICQLDGRIVDVNPALSQMLGYSQQELVGAHAGDFFREDSPEVQQEAHREVGHEIHPVNFPQEERWLGELMRGERGGFEIEKRYRRKDGSELWGHLTVSLGRDARRQPAFLIAMLADATEQRRVKELLREAEKIQVIGRLAGGIAHDFNNLLTGILLYCDLLSAGLEKGGRQNGALAKHELTNQDLTNQGLRNQVFGNMGSETNELDELCQHVEEVRLAGEHGAALTQQLLAIARKQAVAPRPVRINEIVVSTENLLRRLIGEQIELAVVLDSALDSGAGLVLADPAQLRQILLNLVLNARDAMPQGGKIRLITRAAEFPGAESPSAEFQRDVELGSIQRAVSLAVKDNGCGMDAETRRRLFEPFFTTKNPGMGTGLGLATVQRIVRESGGTIKVESQLRRGTLIEIFLPIVEASTQIPTETSSKPSDEASSDRASTPAHSP